ncbi:hypothetical protein BDY24DRAFT_380949 [Mrakia frigida]|uniref:E1 ubiquitin-activating protein AOS1 n=1 Tax=Mrakia frigida TaxID=29902 RepID=UPI003FCC18A6
MSDSTAPSSSKQDGQITEAEAAVYDRQIRLWGLEAQQKMRSSTILIVNLKSLAAETIKNVVLAGIGRLIVMDSEVVAPEDLGAGFLFREGDGVVGQKRVLAALPQIQSLNPLVKVTPMTTTSPLINVAGEEPSSEDEMDAFLRKEEIDIVCVTDASKEDMLRINASCRRTSTLFYGAGGYAFTGYIFSDLGPSCEYFATSPLYKAETEGPKPSVKFHVVTPSMAHGLEQAPFKGMKKGETKKANPGIFASFMALWDYESKHSKLPSSEDAVEEITSSAAAYLKKWEVPETYLPSPPAELISHLALQSTHEFSPTSAILGGMLAQDLLKAMAKKDPPLLNFCAFDGMSAVAWVARFGVGKAEEVPVVANA